MSDKSTPKNEVDIQKNELLTVKEVAVYLRVGRVTIWRWCQQGIIPASQIGRSWRIHRDDLLRFLEKRNLLGTGLSDLTANDGHTAQSPAKFPEH